MFLYIDIYVSKDAQNISGCAPFTSGAVTVLSQLRMGQWSSAQDSLCLSHFGKASGTSRLAIFWPMRIADFILWMFGFQFAHHCNFYSIFLNANL